MADSSSGGGGGLALLLPLVLIVGMIWFMSRSQRKQRQRQADTVAQLQPGTRVITTSGQVGVVDEIEDEYVVLEIAPDVFSRFVKQAIGRVLDDPATALGQATPAAESVPVAEQTTGAPTEPTDRTDRTDRTDLADGTDLADRADRGGTVDSTVAAEDVPERRDEPSAKPTLPPTHTES